MTNSWFWSALLPCQLESPVAESFARVYAVALTCGSRHTCCWRVLGWVCPNAEDLPSCPTQPSPWLQRLIDAAGSDVGAAVVRRVNEAADAVMPLRPPSALATQLLQYLQPASSTERRLDVRDPIEGNGIPVCMDPSPKPKLGPYMYPYLHSHVARYCYSPSLPPCTQVCPLRAACHRICIPKTSRHMASVQTVLPI